LQADRKGKTHIRIPVLPLLDLSLEEGANLGRVGHQKVLVVDVVNDERFALVQYAQKFGHCDVAGESGSNQRN
jgi:hypothetical protein